MTFEALLAYFHLLAILAMVVFLSSEAALCRPEWLNAKVVERLPRVDAIYAVAAGATFFTGLARIFLGAKGAAYYGSHPLLYVKLGLFVAMALLSIRPTRAFLRWRRALQADGSLPAAEEIRAVRKQVIVQAHILPFVPLAAVFLARGF